LFDTEDQRKEYKNEFLCREDIDFISEQYGKNKKGFDYNKAPERGWQEDKKDFSHKQSYRRFHVRDKDDKQPYAVDY
jgi:small subunit ribosomal protein S17